jgi:hypothetical protein
MSYVQEDGFVRMFIVSSKELVENNRLTQRVLYFLFIADDR